MNLKEQQYIVTLAGCGSMTQAAKKLNITQPALSSYLAGVENSLGYPLFERTGKALRPTYLGELYLEPERSWRWGRSSSSSGNRSSTAIRAGSGWGSRSAARPT